MPLPLWGVNFLIPPPPSRLGMRTLDSTFYKENLSDTTIRHLGKGGERQGKKTSGATAAAPTEGFFLTPPAVGVFFFFFFFYVRWRRKKKQSPPRLQRGQNFLQLGQVFLQLLARGDLLLLRLVQLLAGRLLFLQRLNLPQLLLDVANLLLHVRA